LPDPTVILIFNIFYKFITNLAPISAKKKTNTMEDYIYILIGILWIVFSVIKANKKAQRPVEEIEDV